jgi:hypothetical protein
MRTNQVLVITNKDDLHASAVIQHLHDCGRHVFRLNTECLISEYELSFHQALGDSSFTISNIITGKSISLEDLGVVYFRRPAELDTNPSFDEQTADILRLEAKYFLRWLYGFLEDYWLFGSFHDLQRANSKLLQVNVAMKYGFKVPQTFFGNSYHGVMQFFSEDTNIAVKSIRAMGFVKNEIYHSFYTNFISKNSLNEEESAIRSNINFLQEGIKKKYELRVSYVDGKIIPVRIDSQWKDSPANDDWRKIWWTELPHSKAVIPMDIEQKIHGYMKEMRLKFGAFDFIVTENDEYYFLECNPNGQWLWQDELLDVQIGYSIAQALNKCCKR